MKGARLLYVIYALALALLVVVVPLVTHSTGSSAVTGWTSLVSPGPLSPAHTSFQNKCETCHTPHKGVEPVKCIACHIGTDFGTKASTRFHANAKQCTTCHIEHDGGASLTRMNHVALLDPALWRTPPQGGGYAAADRIFQKHRCPVMRKLSRSTRSASGPFRQRLQELSHSCGLEDYHISASFGQLTAMRRMS